MLNRTAGPILVQPASVTRADSIDSFDGALQPVRRARLERARELVIAHGWNATACQILNPGIDHWFSPSLPAVVGYTRRGSVLLVAGAPVCPPQVLRDVCFELEALARTQRFRVCYVGAEARLRDLLAGSANHTMVAFGAQPVWDPRQWSDVVRGHRSLRAQLNRSRNKGVVVEAIAPEQAASSPELREILREWLDARNLPPLRFLAEPDVLDGVMSDRVVLLATRSGAAVAFLVASPITAKNGYLVELLARSPAAPNGTSELLIDAAMRRFAREDRQYVTLGTVAMAEAAQPELQQNPIWLRALLRFARAHANRFYNFKGLEHFRLKLAPSGWEPVYAISNERRFSVRTLYNIGAAFSGIPPWLAIAIGLGRAIQHELRARIS